MKKLLLSIATLFILFCSSAKAQWALENSGFTNANTEVLSVSAVNSNVVWAAAWDSSHANVNGYFTRTINGGTTWTPGLVTGSSGFELSCIYGMDQNNAWVTMNDYTNGSGGIYHTADGGTTWAQQTPSAFSGPAGYGDVIYFFDANNGVAVGDSNTGFWEIYTTVNAGVSWQRMPPGNIPVNLPNEYGQDGVFSVNGNIIWFVTNKGRVFRSIDKGWHWTVSQTGLSTALMISFKDAVHGLVSDATGLNLQQTSDSGTTWTTVAFNGNLYDYGMCFASGAPNAYFTTGYGGSSYSMDNGLTWINLDTLDHTVVQFLNNSTGWTGGWNSSPTVGGMFKWSGVLGINDITNKGDVKIYPNPMSESAFISLNEDPHNAEIILRDISGKIVQHIAGIDEKNIAIHRNGLAAGLYLFTITDETGIIGNGKVIIK